MREYYLREYTPAETFSDAYYMGNGRLGLTSRGHVRKKRCILMMIPCGPEVKASIRMHSIMNVCWRHGRRCFPAM